MYSSGVTTSTSMIGSSRTGPPCARPSFSAMEPAILNAISEESTSWAWPSSSLHLDVDHRVTRRGRRSPSPPRQPCSTAGMNSRGTGRRRCVLELEARCRLPPARGSIFTTRVLTLPPVCLMKGALDGRRGLRDRLLVGDLRPADVGVDLELAQQAVDDDLQVELAHARDDRLAGLFVDGDAEGRILDGERSAPGPSLSWSALVFGSMAIWITGSGNSIASRMIDWRSSHEGLAGGDVP